MTAQTTPCLHEIWQASATVQCGFPSPAADHGQRRIDLARILTPNPEATFHLRARGQSMRDAGIDDGDVLIVDRSLQATHGDMVVAVMEGEFTVKHLYQHQGKVRLRAANPAFTDIELREGQELHIWGVVTWIIKAAHRHASR